MHYKTLMTLLLTICASICHAVSVQELNLDEKIGQVLMVHFQGENGNVEAKRLVQEIHVGAIIYYNWSNGLHDPEQVLSLSCDLQELASRTRLSIPLIIAVDQEGGRVARLRNGFTSIPSNQAVALFGDPDTAKSNALTVGKELRAVGINMNLSPVVDVNSNPENPVIGDRSFSSDPKVVTAYAEKALEGYKEAKIIAVLKHFPGHGDVTIDSHADLPVVNKSITELESIELLPFAKLALAADAIMTAHLLVPALDPERCSTLSKPTLDYLKETLRFKGLILSDSLVMNGVLKQCGSVEEAAIQALIAGCDILILGGKQLVGNDTSLELKAEDVSKVHEAIRRAINTGRISETRLDDAVEKILKFKNRCLRQQDC